MKELITTQLIEEYQKEVKILRTFALTDEVFVRIRETELFISKLKSKQSEERQNIVDAARHDDLTIITIKNNYQ